jgi:hypothetical protein
MNDAREAAARARWRSAEDRLYPALISDPDTYQRALTEIQAIVGVLRARGDDVSVLFAAEHDAAGLVAQACPRSSGLPIDLMVGVACGMRDRELGAQRERLRVQGVLAETRAAGRTWAVTSGPERLGELSDGRTVAVHLPTGTAVTATVDVWSGAPPYGLEVAPPEGEPSYRSFSDRDEWLAAYRRCRSELDADAPGPGRAETARGRHE